MNRLPAECGVAPVTVRQAAGRIELENGLVRLVIDRDGLLASVFDLRAKREVLPEGARGNLLQLHVDRPSSWDAWDVDIFYKDTVENLKAAMAGEKEEFTDMYPPMVAQAKAEGHKKAERSMHDALEVEKVHFELFTKALAAIEGGADLGEIVVRICPNCGHTVIGEAPDKCPVCALKGENYEIIS